MANGCKHERGDHIAEMGFWLCADCWAKLAERPRRYGMPPPPTPGLPRSTVAPQAIVWQASVVKADNGIALNDFLRTMARRYVRKTRPPMTYLAAYGAAIDMLAAIGDPFGDAAYEWSHDDARALADEDMQEWDRTETTND